MCSLKKDNISYYIEKEDKWEDDSYIYVKKLVNKSGTHTDIHPKLSDADKTSYFNKNVISILTELHKKLNKNLI